MNRRERGTIEDWAIAKAKEIAAAGSGGFEAAAKKAGFPVKTVGPFPLNYGDLSVYLPTYGQSMPLFKTVAPSNNPDLSGASTSEKFLTAAFSLAPGAVSDPLILGDKALVLKVKEASASKDDETGMIDYLFPSFFGTKAQTEAHDLFMKSPSSRTTSAESSSSTSSRRRRRRTECDERRRGPPRLRDAGGPFVSYRGRLLYSGREPSKLPAKVAAACDPGPSRLHLVLSPLLWYGVPEILAAMGPGSAALCVEADPALAELARSFMPRELADDGRVSFLETSSPREAIEAARTLGEFRACSTVAPSGGEALNAGAYKAMAAALSAEFESSWRNRAALMVLGDRWAKNIFDNLAALPAIAPEPLPVFPGAAIVCGAGPSLEDALPFISRSRRQLGVIACDTALGTLLSSGIEPDLVVCLEGQAHNLADFTCLGSSSIPLLADLSSHPAAFRAVRGRKHLTLVRITRSAFLSRVAASLSEAALPYLQSPPLGSVGVHAAHLARRLAGGPLFRDGPRLQLRARQDPRARLPEPPLGGGPAGSADALARPVRRVVPGPDSQA